MNLKEWMADIDDNMPLLRLNLVGTHDCVTQYVQLAHLSKCQDRSIYEQLNIGIRCLDIRVKSAGSRLGMVHGTANARVSKSPFSRHMDMSDVLEWCYKFLEQNKKEAIIFQFKNDSCKEQEKCFDILYNTYICANPDKWFLENREPLLGEARGKIVLLRRCNKYDDKNYPLGTGVDFSRWAEQGEAIPNALMLETGGSHSMTFTIQDRYKYKPLPRWADCIKPFLDGMGEFDGGYVINYLSTAGGIKGPENNAKYINKKFLEYELKPGTYYGMIYTDFPTPKLVQKIISTNFK